MIEVLYHLFVWIVSPAAVIVTAVLAMKHDRLLLGAFASAIVLLACAAIAVWMFDGHLLIYQLIYAALAAVPILLFLVATVSVLVQFGKSLIHNSGPRVRPDHVQ